MKIKEVEQLKLWLINAVSPLCDAEPEDLARYVLALLKKEKPEKELEQLCHKELEIFFKDNTLDFITKLFAALSTESYITNSALTTSEHNPLTEINNNLKSDAAISNKSAGSDGRPTSTKQHNTSSRSRPSKVDDLRSKLTSDSNAAVDDHRRHETDRRERRRRSRSRERSRSNERRRKASATTSSRYSSRHHHHHHEDLRNTRLRRRSRDRSRSRDKSRSHERNKKRSRSPLGESGFRSAKYFSSSTSAKKRSRSHSNSRRNQGVMEENKDEILVSSIVRDGAEERRKLSTGHSRSSSIDLKDERQDYRITVPLDNMMAPHHQATHPITLPPPIHHNLQQFATHPPIFMASNPSLAPAPFLGPPPNTNMPPPQISSSMHQDPTLVVLATDAQASLPMGAFSSPPPAMGPPQGAPMILGHPPPSIIHQVPPPHFRPTPAFSAISTNEETGLPFDVPPYIPTSIKSRLGYKTKPVKNMEAVMQQLPNPVQITTTTSSALTTTTTTTNVPSGSSLLINNIPPTKNNISSIDQQFSKFGTILNIQVNFNGNPGSALVSFSTHKSAEAAFSSSEPVFNNRFIEVKWYNRGINENNSNNDNANVANLASNNNFQSSRIVVSSLKRSVKERLGNSSMKIQFSNNVDNKVITTISSTINEGVEVDKHLAGDDINIAVSSDLPAANEHGKRTVLIVPPNSQQVQQQQHVLQQQHVQQQRTQQANVARTFLPSSTKYINYQNHSFKKTRKPPQIVQGKNEILEQKQEILKKTYDFMNKNRLLIEEAIKKQKEIVEQLQKPGISSEEKVSLKNKLEKYEAMIRQCRRDVSFDTKLICRTPAVVSTSSSTSSLPLQPSTLPSANIINTYRTSHPDKLKKELLDLELEEISKRNNGEDVTDVQNRINALNYQVSMLKKTKLRRKMTKFGPGQTSKYRIGAVPYMKSRKAQNSLYMSTVALRKMDKRPKQLVVSGFDANLKNSVIAHLGKFGNMERFVEDGELLLVTYSTRKEAEKAALLGADFGDIKLNISWPKTTRSSPSLVSKSLSSLHNDVITENLILAPFKEENDDDVDENYPHQQIENVGAIVAANDGVDEEPNHDSDDEDGGEEEDDEDDDDSDTMIELVIEDDGARELVDQSLDDSMLDEES